MKSTIKTLFIATSLSLGVVSCERYLDIVTYGESSTTDGGRF